MVIKSLASESLCQYRSSFLGGAESEWNYLSRVTKAAAMFCISPEQCTLSDAADRAQERQMVACCWKRSSMCTLRQWLEHLIIHQLYRCVILAEPSHVIGGVTCNKHAALLIDPWL